MKQVDGQKTIAVSMNSHAMIYAKRITSVVLLAFVFQSNGVHAQSTSSVVTQAGSSADEQMEDDTLIRKLYGGIGFGMASLEPDTSEVPGVDNKDGANLGGQVMIGLDFNKWVSFEGHAASLGTAEFEPSGSLGYQTFGVSALGYVGNARHHYNRNGFSGFGRVGYGYLKNSPSNGLNFKQINPSHLLIGAGVEYAMYNGIAVRAEAISFDTDVFYAQLSVLYRIGRRIDNESDRPVVAKPKVAPPVARAPVVVPKPKPKPVPKPAPVVKPKPPVVQAPRVAAAPVDTDADGVQNAIDRCPNTQPGIAVDEVGCDLFTGVIEGVKFNSSSAVLTASAQQVLDGVIDTLNRFPKVKLTIMAHTDSSGDAGANKQLSKDRARSVAIYLVRNGGISTSRLKAFGYGQDKPISTNDTAAGRQKNRRVELRAER